MKSLLARSLNGFSRMVQDEQLYLIDDNCKCYMGNNRVFSRFEFRIISVLGMILLFLSNSINAQSISDSLEVTAFSNFKIAGYAGKKIDLCIANSIADQDVDHLVEPFRHRNETRQWQSEFWGKWFTAAATAYQYNHDPKLKVVLDKAVADLIATQTADGYIGNYTAETHLQQWDIWGRKYCLLGLLSYYEITNDKKVLVASRKLADHLIKEIHDSGKSIATMGNHRGMAASSVLEPIVKLYKVTNDKKYLDFAEGIVTSWETNHDPGLVSKAIAGVPVAERFPRPDIWWSWQQGQKAYEMMSCYEGLLELYRITGKHEYKEAVIKTAEDIRSNEINIVGSGASMECWFNGAHNQTTPAVHYMETCVTATWMKMCLQVLRITGDVKWANEIEKTYYNALLASMTADGSSWSKYSELSNYRHFGEKQCGMDLNCCIASGPRGMMVIPQFALMKARSGPVLNLFTDATYQYTLSNKKKIGIVVSTKYPTSGEMSIKIEASEPQNFDFQIRVPEWSSQTVANVNSESLLTPPPGTYLHINRTWKNGDEINIQFDVKARVISTSDSKFFYAIQYGALVLATDHRLEHQQDSEFLLPKADDNRVVVVESITGNNPDIYFVAKLPFKTKAVLDGDNELIFCDYASAGNTWTKESAFKVWFPRLMDIAGKDKR